MSKIFFNGHGGRVEATTITPPEGPESSTAGEPSLSPGIDLSGPAGDPGRGHGRDGGADRCWLLECEGLFLTPRKVPRCLVDLAQEHVVFAPRAQANIAKRALLRTFGHGEEQIDSPARRGRQLQY